MASLVRAGRAQSEVVVGAPIQSRVVGSAPVLIETVVGEVAALGGLDVRERDAVVRDSSPIDAVLMSGHVDAVSLAFLQGWPPVRHPQEPPESEDRCEAGNGESTDKAPVLPPPWSLSFVDQG